jgi:hypothetical protein
MLLIDLADSWRGSSTDGQPYLKTAVHTNRNTDINASGGFEPIIPVFERRPRQSGHWDPQELPFTCRLDMGIRMVMQRRLLMSKACRGNT